MAVEVISSFDANMGGTEVFRPMKNIFSNPPKTNKNGCLRERHLLLLTDGAVGNTLQVIDLIKANSENNKVHTFGIGSGASTQLVKESAMAGRGHFYFIDKMTDIDSKVLDCLQRESY
jgi:hypothetical protein